MTEQASGDEEPVRYEERGAVAVVTLNRPRYRNAQNSAMTYALDAAFARAVNAQQVAVIVLAGAGEHFCAGHDIGSPGRDADVSFDRQAVLWWDHVGKPGADARYAREMEVYLGMCRRWREIPKPVIAMVQGACIAGGLMLAWVCDLIVAADDAFFADPVVRMGIPGVEYFAHPWVLGPRFAKEVLFTGERFGALRAYQLGMVNRVVPRAELAEATFALADVIATMPPFGLALAKRAVNQCEDLMGMRPGMDSVFGLHHLAHAHNAEVSGDSLAGLDARAHEEDSGTIEDGRAPVPARSGPRCATGCARTCRPGRCRRWTPPRGSPGTVRGSASWRRRGSRWSPGRPATAAAARRCWSGWSSRRSTTPPPRRCGSARTACSCSRPR